MTIGTLIFQSFTRDVQTTLCLDLLVVCYLSACSRRGLLMYVFPFQFWIRFCYIRTMCNCISPSYFFVGW